MRPVFLDDERVEYFSSTMGEWLAASVRLVPNMSASSIRYDAVITETKQRRIDVALEDLRRPLHRGDAVEVLSKRDGWVAAKISAQQPPHATNFGYIVEYPGEDSTEDKIPAAKVRRRFLEREHIKAYRGVFVGWAPGRVEATCENEEVQDDANVDEEEEDDDIPGEEAFVERRTRRHSTSGTLKSRCPSARSLHPSGARQQMVRVEFDEQGSGMADSEWFLAFLIR